MKERISFLDEARTDNTVSKKQIAKRFFSNCFKRYFLDAFTGMAQGLFVTLIAGTILAQIASWIGLETTFGKILNAVASVAKMLMGAGIGVGIAHALKSPKLVIFAAAVAGLVGGNSNAIIGGTIATALVKNGALSFAPGNPIGAYVVAVIAVECSRLVAGKTKLDIILVPFTMMLASIGACYAAWPFIKLVDLIAKGIEIATTATPFVMGVVISVVMGLLLTLPTSSAAIWIAVASAAAPDSVPMLIAGGAAVCGCAAHMIGFAVASYRENGFGGFIAQGLGTSMLQIPNLMRHPKILLPAVVSSAVVGPLSTCVFKLRCNAAGGGMGTSGLVGVFGVLDVTAGTIPDWQMWLGIVLLMFVLPALISLIVSEIMRKTKWLKFGEMKLPEN